MRLVSLCPSLTELLFDLGAGHELIGRTKFCVHPADRVEPIEKLGGTKNPKIDRVIALAPDLVLMNEEENRREDADQLRAAGIAVHASMPRTATETAAMVRSIGGAIGRLESANDIAIDIEACAARARRGAEGLPDLRYAYLIWREPWMTVNDDTFVSALLALPGARNVFGTASDRYPEIALEALRAADPDIVLLSSEPFPFTAVHAQSLGETLGWPPTRFALVDGELLSWHGSRTPRGIAYAARLVAEWRRRATTT